MLRNSAGEKSDTERTRFHMEMQCAIHKSKTPEGGFGRVGILTQEQFKKNCETAQKMSDLARGRW